jgi:hypothetical protein
MEEIKRRDMERGRDREREALRIRVRRPSWKMLLRHSDARIRRKKKAWRDFGCDGSRRFHSSAEQGAGSFSPNYSKAEPTEFAGGGTWVAIAEAEAAREVLESGDGTPPAADVILVGRWFPGKPECVFTVARHRCKRIYSV